MLILERACNDDRAGKDLEKIGRQKIELKCGIFVKQPLRKVADF